MSRSSRKQKQPNADKASYSNPEVLLGGPAPRGTYYSATMRDGRKYRISDKGQITRVRDAE